MMLLITLLTACGENEGKSDADLREDVLVLREEIADLYDSLDAVTEDLSATMNTVDSLDGEESVMLLETWEEECGWGEEVTMELNENSVFTVELYYTWYEEDGAWYQALWDVHRIGNELSFLCGSNVEDYGPTKYRVMSITP